MKKSTRIVKRLLALFLVVLMSIESIGAVVSDNDGSAFITKAEFDSLKNNFQSQIDQYNTSIDSKIDGAIASYLAGINVAKETTYNVEFKNWGKVLATNYVLPEEWKIPDLNLTFNYNYSSTNDGGTWYEIWWGSGAISFTRSLTNYQVRNLVSAGEESTNYTLPDKVVWLGQSQNYVERISGVKTGVCKSVYGGWIPGNSYLAGATSGGAGMNVINSLEFASGNIQGRAVNDIWAAKLYYSSLDGYWNATVYPTVESDWINRDLGTSISLNYVNGAQYKNEHIINWNNYNYTNLSDPTWTHSFGYNPSFTENDVITNSYVSKKGKWSVFEIQDSTRAQAPAIWQQAARQYTPGTVLNTQITYQPVEYSFNSFYSGGYGATRNNNIVSVGVLDRTYTSSDIYQWSKKHTLLRDENKYIENVNLLNGFVVGYAKQDEIFKWEPKVTGSYYDTATNTNKPITKWRVKLSKNPFGAGDSVDASSDVLKNKNQTNDYLVTNETTGVCKFEVEVGDDTVIFCKWWPDDTNICNNYQWNGTLDLTACGTYTIKEAS